MKKLSSSTSHHHIPPLPSRCHFLLNSHNHSSLRSSSCDDSDNSVITTCSSLVGQTVAIILPSHIKNNDVMVYPCIVSPPPSYPLSPSVNDVNKDDDNNNYYQQKRQFNNIMIVVSNRTFIPLDKLPSNMIKDATRLFNIRHVFDDDDCLTVEIKPSSNGNDDDVSYSAWLTSRVDNNDDDDILSLLYYPHGIVVRWGHGPPTPLSSLTIVRICSSMTKNKQQQQHQKQQNKKYHALLSSRMKRDMVGRLVIPHCHTFINNPFSSSYDEDDKSGEEYRISTVFPSRGDCFLVTSETRITLEEEEEETTTMMKETDDEVGMMEESTMATPETPTKQQQQPSSNSHHPDDSFSGTHISPAQILLTNTLTAMERLRSSSPPSSSIQDVPRCFLLSGPPGVGKTHAVRSVLRRYPNVRFMGVNGSNLVDDGGGGELSRRLTSLFHRAWSSSTTITTLLFLDEFDALASSPLISMTLCHLLDEVSSCKRSLMIVAATNRVDAIPSYLRRHGRFDVEVVVSAPTTMEERCDILKTMLKGVMMERSVLDEEAESEEDSTDEESDNEEEGSSSVHLWDHPSLPDLAASCVGFTPADLASLLRHATLSHPPPLTFPHLLSSLPFITPSALRSTPHLTRPPTTTTTTNPFDAIAGSAGGAKSKLLQIITYPHTKRHLYHNVLHLSAPRGVLLHGPPGCAKTSLARAAAQMAKTSFLSLGPADVYSSSYVGEAEGVIRRAFALARTVVPCVLFFDEIDAILGGARNERGAEGRVMSTFLNEMDGVDVRRGDGVLVLAATNRPEVLDEALLRKGRFDEVVYVPPPDEGGRRELVGGWVRRWGGGGDDDDDGRFDVAELVKRMEMMTGAEIVGVCREASLMAVREGRGGEAEVRVEQWHVEKALEGVKPLLKEEGKLEEYSQFEMKHGAKKKMLF